MHLSDDSIRLHLDGVRDPSVDAHLTLCLPCTLRVGGAAHAGIRWERRGMLGRLVRVPAEPQPTPLVAAEQRRAA